MSACTSQAITTPSEDEEFLFAMEMNALIALPLVLKATIELGILEILAECGPMAPLSPAQIASRLSAKNPEAPVTLDRILRFLASYSILSCTLAQDTEGNPLRLYGLGPKSKHFVRAHGTATFAAPLMLLLTDNIVTSSWYCLKEEIMEGGDTFKLANGLHYTNKDRKFNEIFNNAMQGPTNMYMSKIVESYQGFNNVKTVVDVGGGMGANLRILLSKHPHIHGKNFDLPHVVKEAPPYPGKLLQIIHGADDKLCVKLLKNCWEALPEKGKVVIVDAVLPKYPETDIITRNALLADMSMLNITPGEKDRTEREFEVPARASGFDAPKLLGRAYNMWVVELHKRM
ncbi:LOW QUALITY PROTEIN: hypothetical protein EUGRSUZ_I02810 [Eucalyptus grandis]|uniref:Uncharacterized protein n=1 Tax=Eucalyptus grandis TaxID=71139 RepID=A0ACC3JJS7_EUCGR|nr:LOW QUALITY PROTEIN: hypothetical protein EUGRSUZ_I02810 [Eucalyptus grandis]